MQYSYYVGFLSFFLLWGGTYPIACQRWGLPHRLAECATPGKGLVSVARHHHANLMVCVVCSCCATSPYREVCMAKGGIGSAETLCRDIYHARPIWPVFLWRLIPTAWWTALVLAHLVPWTPVFSLAAHVNRAINDWPAHTAGHHFISVVQAATNTERL